MKSRNLLLAASIFMGVICVSLAFGLPSLAAVGGMLALTLVPAKVMDPQNPGQEIPPFTRAQKFLWDYLRGNKGRNIVTYDALRSGALVFNPVTYYIRKVLPFLQQGRFPILGSATQEVVGVTNFPTGAVLQQWYNFCVDKIEVGYGSTTSADADIQSIAGFSSVLGSMPAAVRNAELIISVNRNIVVETPVTDFGSKAAVTGGGARDFDGGNLQVPKIFPENQLIEADINLASGQSTPNTANNTFGFEILFQGVEARLRG